MRKVKNVRRQQVCLKVPKVGSLEKAENCTTEDPSGSDRHSSQNCRLRKQRTSPSWWFPIHREAVPTPSEVKQSSGWNLLNPGPQRLFMMPVTDISCKYFFPSQIGEGWPSEHVGSGGESRTMLILSPSLSPSHSPSLPFSLLPNT